MEGTMGFGGRLAAWTLCVFALGAPRQSPQPLPRTSLPLTLVGVIVDAAEPSSSLCLIRCAYPSQRVRTFGPGENACDVAEVEEVRADAVVVRNLLANRSELLSLQDAKPSATVQAPGDAKDAARPSPAPPPPVVRASSDVVTIEVPEASVTHYLANLPELLRSARASPRYRDAEFGRRVIEGFEIDQIKAAGVVEQMGLKNGDVVLDLNGQPLDSLESAIRLFGQAQGMTQSRMTVLRNGRRMTFVLNRK
jgi:type II secretory pathway component PulC